MNKSNKNNMRFISKFASCFGVAVLQACSSGVQGQGSCQLAISPLSGNGLTTNNSQILGGYIDLKLSNDGKKRCTAQFEPFKKGNDWHVGVSFGRHCYQYQSAKIESAKLQIYHPSAKSSSNGEEGAFITEVPIQIDELSKRNEARLALSSLPISAKTQEKLVTNLFTDQWFEEATGHSSFCELDPTADENSDAFQAQRSSQVFKKDGLQVLCFEPADFDYKEGRISLDSSFGSEKTEMLNSLFAQFEQPENVDPSKLQGAAAIAAKETVDKKESVRFEPVRKASVFGEFELAMCDEQYADIFTLEPNLETQTLKDLLRNEVNKVMISILPEICPHQDKIVAALAPLLKVNNKTPGEYLKSIGYKNPRESYTIDLYGASRAPDNKSTTEVFKELRKSLGSNKNSYFGISSIFKDKSGGNQKFATYVNPQFDPEDDSSARVMIHVPQDKNNPTFEAADSGSVLSFGGLFPLAILSSVDGVPVSGGISVVPLDEAASGEDTTARTSNRAPTSATPAQSSERAESPVTTVSTDRRGVSTPELDSYSGAEGVQQPTADIGGATFGAPPSDNQTISTASVNQGGRRSQRLPGKGEGSGGCR